VNHYISGETKRRNPHFTRDQTKNGGDFDRSVLNHEPRVNDFPVHSGELARPSHSAKHELSRGVTGRRRNHFLHTHDGRYNPNTKTRHYEFRKHSNLENLQRRHTRHLQEFKDRRRIPQIHKFLQNHYLEASRGGGRHRNVDHNHSRHPLLPITDQINEQPDELHNLGMKRRQNTDSLQKQRRGKWRRRLGASKRRGRDRPSTRLDGLLPGFPRSNRRYDHTRRSLGRISRIVGKESEGYGCFAKHKCPPASPATLVCGSDDVIYSNECVLRITNCV